MVLRLYHDDVSHIRTIAALKLEQNFHFSAGDSSV